MFARLFIVLIISVCPGSLAGQVCGPTPVGVAPGNFNSRSPVQYSFRDTIHSPVRQVSWQDPDDDVPTEINQDTVSGLQLELDLKNRRKSVTDENKATAEKEGENDDYQLPKLANVNDPIALAPLSQIYQDDPSDLLVKQPQRQEAIIAEQLSYADLTGTFPIPSTAHWAAPNFYHRPLLFEETNLERYGNKRRFQNLSSAAHFLGTIPVLPYKIGQHPRCYREYTLKHRRPGDCVPYEVEQFHFDVHGGFWQALATAAIVIP